MSALAAVRRTLLPPSLPLHVEGGRRFIGHVIRPRDFPERYRAAASEVWDALIDLDHRNITMLDDDLTDLFLAQYAGRCPRFIQVGLFALELGPKALHELVALERTIRRLLGEMAPLEQLPEPTEADRGLIAELGTKVAKLQVELTLHRNSRHDLKDRLGKVNGDLAKLRRLREPTDADRARIAELARAAALLRADLVADDAVIFRHSGPGFEGKRHIEILARLAGAKAKDNDKAKAKAPGAPARPSETNVQVRAIEERLTAKGEARAPEMTAEEKEQAAAVLARLAAKRKADADAQARAARPSEVRKTREQLLAEREEARGRRADAAPQAPEDPGVPPQPGGP